VAAAFAGALALSGLACSGCGYDEKKAVATLDGKNVITVGDFVYHYKRAVEMAPPQDKPVINTYDDAKEFLDDLITSRVLEMEADRLGYGKDPNLTREVDNYRSAQLKDKVRQRTADQIKVTEAEILDFYNKNKEFRRVSFIVCDKKAPADKAYAELVRGRPWNDVVKTYSVNVDNKDKGGEFPTPVPYTGDNVSRAVYATAVGKFTPVVALESGDSWLIFRVDKKVPGDKQEYAKVKDAIRQNIRDYRTEMKIRELVRKLRKEAKITVNQELYDAVIKGSVADAAAKYDRKGKFIADVGGVPVHFDTWFEGMYYQIRMDPAAVDEYKKREPAAFKRLMDDRLRVFEDDALLEYEGIRSGIAKDPEFVREVNKFRAGMMVDRLYNEVFVPTVPAITDADIQRYFDAHKAEFQDPERAEVAIFISPDRAAIDKFLAQAKTAANIEDVGKAFAEAFPPPVMPAGGAATAAAPPENKRSLADYVLIPKVPQPTAPGAPGAEPPLIGELRPRVFAAKEGDVVGPFQIRDGRWAFFKFAKHNLLVQHTLAELPVADRCKAEAKNEKLASPEVDRKCQAWFKALRAKRKIVIDESALKMAFKKVQKLT
jgi:peptidyl-prolyl cis-trans isomerase C